ncbi:MAG: hypothetical protein AB7O60_03060 [Variibacter sp.]
MSRLRLSLRMSSELPRAPASGNDPLTFQVWRGGPCVGGTLDPGLRGREDGERQCCAIADYRDDDAALPKSDQNFEQINPGGSLSPDNAGALFIVMMSIAPAVEEEFNDWYDLEHIPRLIQVPGVIRARRFRALAATSRYMAVYHLADAAAYAEASWCDADRTPWIGRMRRFQSDRRYFMFKPA